jgi:hypothetical protein
MIFFAGFGRALGKRGAGGSFFGFGFDFGLGFDLAYSGGRNIIE